jgi:MoaA/NifB/PqqE/SkfB family radical SAM enzyme
MMKLAKSMNKDQNNANSCRAKTANIQEGIETKRESTYSIVEENTRRRYQKTFKLALRLSRGLFSNLVGVRAPLFCGHKLTYNCNLKCKMCPFWKRSNIDLSTEDEKAVLRQIYDSGACAIAFEGGEPFLRKDLGEILAFSKSLPLQTSLITNGTLLESKIDEVAQYINGAVYVSLDGLEKTHDSIRGVNGCFKKAIQGITAASKKVSVVINTTIMAENVNEIEDLVRLAKDLDVKISLAVAYEYFEAETSTINLEIQDIAEKLVELKKYGYPLINSISYFKVIAKQKKWTCKPWLTINVSPEGSLVLPCYVRNGYAKTVSVLKTSIKTAISDYNWKETRKCQNCSLHCYVEPSLALSYDFGAFLNWAL